MNDISDATGPIEVWLSQSNMEVTCTVVFEDESTDTLGIEALSLRGAEREITGWLIAGGWQPAGRWQDARDLDHGRPEAWVDGPAEVMRQFRRAREQSEAKVS